MRKAKSMSIALLSVVMASTAVTAVFALDPAQAQAEESSATVFSSVADFTLAEQGYRGWYYLHGAPDDIDSFSSCMRIRDNRYWQGRNDYTLADNVSEYVGETGDVPVRAWVASESGSISLTVSAYMAGGSDPFLARLYQNDTSLLAQDWILPNAAETKAMTLTVAEGDVIYYYVRAQEGRGVAGCESRSEITISYTSITETEKRTYDSSEDFRIGMQGYRGWYYMYGDKSDVSSFVNCTGWYDENGAHAWWQGSTTYTLQKQTRFIVDSWDIVPVRAWRAPVDCTVSVSVDTWLINNVPVAAEIWHNDTRLIDRWDLEQEGGSNCNKTLTVSMQEGDFLYYVAYAGGNRETDSFASNESYVRIALSYDVGTKAKLETAIDSLPATVTMENRAEVAAVASLADSMTDTALAFVDAEKLARLQTADTQRRALDVDALIGALPETVTLESRTAIEAARAAYDALSEEAKALVKSLAALEAAEEDLAALLVINELKPLIDAIPDVVTAADRKTVLAAKEKFDSYTPQQQASIAEADLNKLNNAIDTLLELEKKADVVFRSQTGHSSVQGANGWYYEYNIGGGFVQMDYFDTVNEDWSTSSAAYAIIRDNSIHPSSSGSVAKTFRAPYGGVIDLSGYAYKKESVGCSLTLSVTLNDADLFADAPIAQITPSTSSWDTRVTFGKTAVEVKAGDVIRFVYSAVGGNNANGSTLTAVEIAYTAIYDAGFSYLHGASLPEGLASEIKIGEALALGTQFSAYPADVSETVNILVTKDADSVRGEEIVHYYALKDYVIDKDGRFRAFVPGTYCIQLVGSVSGAVFDSATVNVVSDEKVFNSYEDFDSNLQVNPQAGIGGWYYMYSVSGGAPQLSVKTYPSDGHFGGEGTYVRMGRQDNVFDMTDDIPVRAWKAPATGTVNLGFLARGAQGSEAGYTYSVDVRKNDALIAEDWTINSAQAQLFELSEISVTAGDYIYFYLSATGNISGSNLYTTINFTYTSVVSDNLTAVNQAAEQLPADLADLTEANGTAVDTAVAALEKLTDLERSFLAEGAEKKIADAAARMPAVYLQGDIAALPALDDLTLAHKDAVDQALLAYNALSAEGKAWVTNAAALMAASDKIAGLEVAALIDALPENVTLGDALQVTQAADAYQALTEAQKAYVTNVADLTAAQQAIESAQADAEAAAEVEALIEAIPAEVTSSDKIAIELARKEYDALTDARKAMVSESAVQKLTAAEAALAEIEATERAAEEVSAMIDALPATITYAAVEAVDAAKAAYDALSEDAKAMVGNVAVLNAAVATAQMLKLAKTQAEQVDALIAALPAEITLENRAAVEAAREAYNALSADAKALVGSLGTLELAEAAIERLENEQAQTPSDPSVSDGEQFPGWAIAVIVVAGVVIVAGIVVGTVIILKKRKK